MRILDDNLPFVSHILRKREEQGSGDTIKPPKVLYKVEVSLGNGSLNIYAATYETSISLLNLVGFLYIYLIIYELRDYVSMLAEYANLVKRIWNKDC